LTWRTIWERKGSIEWTSIAAKSPAVDFLQQGLIMLSSNRSASGSFEPKNVRFFKMTSQSV
jgi:hypothetical protein